jgi:hypothetical protein
MKKYNQIRKKQRKTIPVLEGGRLTFEMKSHEKSDRGVASPAVRKEGISRPELDGVTWSH